MGVLFHTRKRTVRHINFVISQLAGVYFIIIVSTIAILKNNNDDDVYKQLIVA